MKKSTKASKLLLHGRGSRHVEFTIIFPKYTSRREIPVFQGQKLQLQQSDPQFVLLLLTSNDWRGALNDSISQRRFRAEKSGKFASLESD